MVFRVPSSSASHVVQHVRHHGMREKCVADFFIHALMESTVQDTESSAGL